MSHHSSSAAPQPQPLSSHSPNHSELAKRIERFQEAAQNLLAMYEPAGQGRDYAQHPASSPTANGETRCYYLSPGAVQHERELLQKYHAEDFCGLLAEAHMLLVGFVKAMKNTRHDARVKGYVIVSLGGLLEQASSLLLRMRNVYDKVERLS